VCKKLIYLISFVVALNTAGSVSADLVAHWRLDETSGTTAYDSSGNRNDGTLNGNPQWAAGTIGGALHLDGSGDYVRIPFGESLRVLNSGDFTFTMWLNADAIDKKHIVFQQMDVNGLGRSWLTIGNGNADNAIRTYVGGAWTVSGFVIEAGEWYHAAVVVTEGGSADSIQIYVNGQPQGNPRLDSMEDCEGDFIIGCAKNLTATFTEGLVDDVRIYSQAMTEEELQVIMTGVVGMPLARRPNPADGALYEQTWANLTWTAGDWAVSHDLYFGTTFADVNERAEGTYIGNLPTAQQVGGCPGFPASQGLEPGTNYYWRIDEVNDANDQSPWKGDVWSFRIPPKSAYDPVPADEGTFADPNVDLSWAAGLRGMMGAVYFGTDADELANAAGAPPVTGATFDPGPLALDTTYYWRVDMFDGMEWTKGNIWSFTTLPDVAIADPNLTVWWTLDEGPDGMTIVDWSGHGHHGTLINGPQWADGVSGGALQFDGINDFVLHSLPQGQNFASFTVALWVKAATLGQGEWMAPFSSHTPNSSGIQIDVDGTNPGNYRTTPPGGTTQIFGPVTRGWVHLALVGRGTTVQYYYNGIWTTGATLTDDDLLFNEFIIGTSRNRQNSFGGTIDDLRVYNTALTEADIQLVMRGDPLLAWDPSPTDESTPDIDNATPLGWSPGDKASEHEVYFGTDKDAVDNADSSDTTGIYRGRQNGTSYTPPEGVEWGGGPYYWRVDENNNDGTVTKGRIWSFAVADFILVDDFESYTDNDTDNEAIWQAWVDGFGVPTNGSQVGYVLPPYAEQAIVNGGFQSMPILYDNASGATNSEVELALTAGRDWTRHAVGVLSLWFRGYPPSVGGFTENPAGTFTMTAAGADITGPADEFHYAYKTLTGPGAIVARIDSVQNTHGWAKAGVMIRETLDPNSAHAMAFVTPGQGVVLEYRLAAGQNNVGAAAQETAITMPHWVKLERDAAGNFTASHSTNGSSWTAIQSSIPQNIQMASSVYIGLALTSHDASATCEAKFSDVTVTGTVGPQWVSQDIGILGNNAELLYVSLSNAGGAPAVVVNDDPEASVTDIWTEWNIDLQQFSDLGIDLTNVDRIAIGLGTQGNATAPGGSGTLFIDDIRLLRPIP